MTELSQSLQSSLPGPKAGLPRLGGCLLLVTAIIVQLEGTGRLHNSDNKNNGNIRALKILNPVSRKITLKEMRYKYLPPRAE